jgi:hypothetical protein
MATTEDLWVEAYQGEVLGEALFGTLAGHQTDPDRRRQLDVVTRMERRTRLLIEPVLRRRGLDGGDDATTAAGGVAMAEAAAAVGWDDLLGSIEPATARYLDAYRALVEQSTGDEERSIATTLVAHERALATFARRALGREDGDPLEAILALPHVAADDAEHTTG